MEFALLPKSPRTTIVLVVVLAGAGLFVVTSGSKSKKHRPGSPVAAAIQAAQVIADLAVPGPGASLPGPAGPPARVDTLFGENPFASLASEGDARDMSAGGTDDAGFSNPASGAEPIGRAPQRLLGTITDGERVLALIDNKYYAPGQMVGDWRLTFVGSREARLNRQGQTITLRVGL